MLIVLRCSMVISRYYVILTLSFLVFFVIDYSSLQFLPVRDSYVPVNEKINNLILHLHCQLKIK